jgi:protoheme IX farnesyltransferase
MQRSASDNRQPPRERSRGQASSLPRLLLVIAKPRIVLAIALISAAGIAVSPGAEPPLRKVAVVLSCVVVASAAAGGFNHLYEAGLDRQMRRTGSRPFASGALNPTAGWIALFVAGMTLAPICAWVFAGPIPALFIALGAVTYAFVYTIWLKRRTWWSVVVGGLAGSFAALAGAALVSPLLPVQAWVLAALVFAWTPPHLWALAIRDREDYAAARIPMLPVVKGEQATADAVVAGSVFVVALSILLGVSADEPLVLMASVFGGTWFFAESLILSVRPTVRRAGRCFGVSLAQLGVVLIAVLVARAL